MYIDKQLKWKLIYTKLSTCYFSVVLFFPYITLLLKSASLKEQNLFPYVGGCKVVCLAWHGGLSWKPCSVAVCVLVPFLLSDLPRLEGLQTNRWKKEMKTIVDFSCGKYQHVPVSLLMPTATCLLELSSYVVSLHWGKAWLRRILKWANAESRWQTLAAMISSLIICTACCGRRPGRPANRRAQEGRESVLSHLQEAARLSVKTPISIRFTHHSYLVKCKCRSSEPWTLIRAELRKSNIVLYITPWNWV